MRKLAPYVLALAAAGCGGPTRTVTGVAANDPRMNAAMEKARSTCKEFTAALANKKPGQGGYSVKVAVKDGEQVEHMWLSDVQFDGTKFTGRIGNAPEMVKTVGIGTRLRMVFADVGPGLAIPQWTIDETATQPEKPWRYPQE